MSFELDQKKSISVPESPPSIPVPLYSAGAPTQA